MPSNIDKPADYINLSKDEFDIELVAINDIEFLRNKRYEFLGHIRDNSEVIRMNFSDEVVKVPDWILQPDYLYLIDKRAGELALSNGIEDADCMILDLFIDELNNITDISLLEKKKEVCNDRLEIALGKGSQSVDISLEGEVDDGQKIYLNTPLLTFYIEERIKELQKEMCVSKESDTPSGEPFSPPSFPVRSSSMIVSL
ncbi:MAG: hypothetical protein ACI9W5_000034 [Ulvibacter sp.]|jgi:hypothetical protein